MELLGVHPSVGNEVFALHEKLLADVCTGVGVKHNAARRNTSSFITVLTEKNT